MKQKIVIKVSFNGNKSRSKAMKIAVGVSGVESAGLGGEDKSQIEVKGDGVDPVVLTTLLRKKCGHAELISVSVEGDKKEEDPKMEVQVHPYVSPYGVGYPVYVSHYNDPNSCSIM